MRLPRSTIRTRGKSGGLAMTQSEAETDQAFGLPWSPIFVGAAMALKSVSVVTSVLRLNRIRL
jgi:cation transport ATPase